MGNVVEDGVHPRKFEQVDGERIQQIPVEASELRSHHVFGNHGAQHHAVVVAAPRDGEQDDEQLEDFVHETVVLQGLGRQHIGLSEESKPILGAVGFPQ